MTGHVALTGSLSEIYQGSEHKIYRHINVSFSPDRNGHIRQSDMTPHTLGLGRLKCSKII